MEAPENIQTDKNTRPYRSRLQPACNSCRKRKSRCKTAGSSSACATCQLHGTECVYPRATDEISQRNRTPRRLAAKSRQDGGKSPASGPTSQIRKSTSSFNYNPQVFQQIPGAATHIANTSENLPGATDHETRHEDLFSNFMGIVAETGDDSSHIVSPAVANDNDILESYLSTIPGARRRCLIRPSFDSGRAIKPVLFNTVSRRPLGMNTKQTLAATKCEYIEKYLEPGVEDVVDLFFQIANICFPIFDEASFRNVYLTHKETISPALLCNLYANTLVYWGNSPKLRSIRSPDVRFIWNQANEALNSELFLSPGISTVMAIILNVCGRPSTSMFGNGGMIGTAVALCNALGLNRDPSNWNISPLEKRFRIRIWWLVNVHDSWCSLAYGTPPQINRAQHDVPFPKLEDFCDSNTTPDQKAASSIFITLTTLTDILGRYLEHIYQVSKINHPYPPEMQSATYFEHILSKWEESLPDDIRRLVLRGTHLNAPGAANFRLAYLAVKLLLRRIQLDLDTKDAAVHVEEDITTSPFYLQAQRAAEDIVHLVQELDESHFRGFWIPVNAFSLTSATTFLLRSGLRMRTSTSTSGNAPLRIAREMTSTLHSHRLRFSWDIADHCLASCSDLAEKISSVEAGGDGMGDTSFLDFENQVDMDLSALKDFLDGFPGFVDGLEMPMPL
ncbi:Zn(II)2Cys6 transcription factor [Aspergillus ruber CBS 135680]|uniref:Zn(2)-C6 fungal-type domain-containing protein n=1 Tax=Aspergillus ruber (strain CBS 135680) TaxID=1388766 RepID=A0A017SBP0_ASPRC|nr:uncharacterized protein EURHEDRAFT_91584 [Aspergillus ruber CBS 135680]EYE94458.1 hypothetical protein EURHEDRAFT_91584 [Aspergillus ruber CBS 135680]